MSGQPGRTTQPAVFRILVASTLPTQSQVVKANLPSIGIFRKISLVIKQIYFVEGDLDDLTLQRLASLVCDPVTERYEWRSQDKRPGTVEEKVLEVALRPGVTDNVANELLKAAHRMGIHQLKSAATGQRYEFSGELSDEELDRIARILIVNSTIQRYTFGELDPEFLHPARADILPIIIPIRGLSEEDLRQISQERRLALDLREMQAIQVYFTGKGRDPTDAELETLAQTWSEHCTHKTFKALITASESREGDAFEIDGLLRTYLRSATESIAAPWVRSAFVDNAGVIEFDDENDLSFKVETHNHPSAIEPFGGANTGVGGVVRDILGVSHRPIANTDVLCFGPEDLSHSELPPGVLHPRRIRAGVVSGVEDYGNKLGLPTVNGAVIYHPGYTANPLVYCGCVGIGPRETQVRTPQPGDRVIVIGGRTGRDGLRGATFSSLTMDAQTGEVAGSAVQIGDPITEKGVIEVVERARDAGLYHAITDCGAGGLSSAVGEMASSLGARVDLEKVTLKYAGLAPWEVWLSEAQERMVLAVPRQSLPALAELCETYWVEWSDLGEFVPTGRLEVTTGTTLVLDLENEFLHGGMPRLELRAHLGAQAAVMKADDASQTESSSAEVSGMLPADLLLRLLAHPNIASKMEIVRVYDHEVRGATVIKPLVGCMDDGPSDAAVLKPMETAGWRGFVLANGVNPTIGEIDSYAMAVSAVDEAVRNAVAVGADPSRIALLDNFCWGDPHRPDVLGGLVRAAQGCCDASLHYHAPFISGKDSLNNEYLGMDGLRHAIPGTLLISSIGIHPDVRCAVTMDLKTPKDRLYLVGEWKPALAGSYAGKLAPGAFSGAVERTHVLAVPEYGPSIYAALHRAVLAGWVRAAHDLSEGGLAVAAAEMCLGGRLGLSLDLSTLHPDPWVALFAETNGCLLVEVEPAYSSDFEALMREGLPKELPTGDPEKSSLRLLGEISETPVFSARHIGKLIIDLPVSELASAFFRKE